MAAKPRVSGHIWRPEIVERIADFLPPNDIACTLRLTNKATAAHFSKQEHRRVRLSQPCPGHAFAWHWLQPGAVSKFRLRNRIKLIRLVAAAGDIENLKLAIQAAGCLPSGRVWEEAAKAGQLLVCIWLWQNSFPLGSEPLSVAAEAGQVEICQWLLSQRIAAWDFGAVRAAVRGGRRGAVEALLSSPLASGRRVNFRRLFLDALDGFELTELRNLYDAWAHHHDGAELIVRRLDADVRSDILAAAAGCRTSDWADKVEWTESLGCRTEEAATAAVAAAAAQRPDARERLAWLRQRGYPIGACAAAKAAGKGRVEALKYMLAERLPVDAAAAFAAVRHAHRLEVLEMLYDAGVRLAPYSSWFVFSCGHRDVILWYIEKHLDESIESFLPYGAKSGSLTVLTAMLEKRRDGDLASYTMPDTLFNDAVRSGNEAVVRHLLERKCPMPETGQPYIKACENGDLAMIGLLAQLGCSWGRSGEVFSACVRQRECHLKLLLRLVEEGCPVDWGKAEDAARGRKDNAAKVLEWVVEAKKQAAVRITNQAPAPVVGVAAPPPTQNGATAQPGEAVAGAGKREGDDGGAERAKTPHLRSTRTGGPQSTAVAAAAAAAMAAVAKVAAEVMTKALMRIKRTAAAAAAAAGQRRRGVEMAVSSPRVAAGAVRPGHDGSGFQVVAAPDKAPSATRSFVPDPKLEPSPGEGRAGGVLQVAPPSPPPSPPLAPPLPSQQPAEGASVQAGAASGPRLQQQQRHHHEEGNELGEALQPPRQPMTTAAVEAEGQRQQRVPGKGGQNENQNQHQHQQPPLAPDRDSGPLVKPMPVPAPYSAKWKRCAIQ